MPIDWVRPRFYAARIKSLVIDWDFTETPKIMDILKAMGLFYPSGGLLPNLRCLECHSHGSCPDLTSLRVLLHPQVKKISFTCSPSITNLSFLSALPVICPRLRCFGLSFCRGEYCPEAAAVVSTLLPALQTLKSLWLDVDIRFGPTVAGSFPCLQEFTMLKGGVASVMRLLSAAADLDLIKIDLCLFPATTTSQIAELAWRGDVMKAHTLRELSFFHGLNSVYIAWSFGPDLDDKTLDLLTASWTQLTNLQLIQGGKATNLTLKSLLALGQNCPHLQCLRLMIDAREVPELPRVASQRSLELLAFGSSPIQNATKVARYLSGIFLDLRYIQSDVLIEYRQLWKQVSELLPEFVAVRKEEREQVRAG
ncbi:hypothetical protein MSAN_00563000 [Mycena sanguinolenta]|uniref:Uncharacterized protein n=1 Tax=Mycena sanguinolenta TaxID=230812 RepID=A0A8H7DJF4_9AGAR|nr:hypothetical protein MSAN_00563000 [Mycena sanguinolenta]